MIDISLSRQIELGLRRLIPTATVLVAVLVDLLPIPDPSPESLAPFMTLCVVYYWTVHRPDLMLPVTVFATGLVLDVLAGLPLGFNALVLTLAVKLLAPHQKALVGSSPVVIWFFFALVALAVTAARWLVACIWWGRLFDMKPLLFEAALTVVVFPLVSGLLNRVATRLPRISYASGS